MRCGQMPTLASAAEAEAPGALAELPPSRSYTPLILFLTITDSVCIDPRAPTRGAGALAALPGVPAWERGGGGGGGDVRQ